jgi:hypothetical protein
MAVGGSPRSVAESPEVACLHGLAADAERPCRRPAAVAAYDLASDTASAWRAEKGDERRRVFGTAKAAERHLRLDPLAQLRREPAGSVGPGSTALTLIPRGANSAAAETVIHSSAPLLAA